MLSALKGYRVHYLSMDDESAGLLRRMGNDMRNLKYRVVQKKEEEKKHISGMLSQKEINSLLMGMPIYKESEISDDQTENYNIKDEEEREYVPENGAIELIEGYGLKDCKLEISLVFEKDKNYRFKDSNNQYIDGCSYISGAREIDADYAYVIDDKLVLVYKKWFLDKQKRVEIPIDMIARLIQTVEITGISGFTETCRVTIIDTEHKVEKDIMGEEWFHLYHELQNIGDKE